MAQSFEKLKFKALLSVILKCVTVGLSCGFFVVDALMLAFKFSSVEFFWPYYIPIGVGVALISGGVCFWLLRPTNKKIAIKYDAEYGLNQKLQTMVEFEGRGQEGDIIALQRQDTLARIAALPRPQVNFSLIAHYAAQVWQYVAIAAVAVVATSASIYVYLTPAQSVDEPPSGVHDVLPVDPDEDEFEYTLAMQSEVDDLINSVRDSELDEEIRSFAVDRLTELSKTLTDITLKSDMQTEVYAAVKDIDDLIVSSNTFAILSEYLSEADENLSNGLVRGFVSYKGRLMKDMPQNYVYALKDEIDDYIEKDVQAFITEAAKKLLVPLQDDNGDALLRTVLIDYTTVLDEALYAAISDVDEEDALYQSLQKLYESLDLTKERVIRGGVEGDDAFHSEIWQDPKDDTLNHDAAFNQYTTSSVNALCVQSYKCIMEVYVRQRLADILKVSFDGLPALYEEYIYIPGDDPGTGNDPGKDPSGNGGGIGTGDVVYGSNDLIYDPRTGQQVPFGEVLKEYENAIMAGTADEEFPPELAKYLETYLNYLHNGTDKKDE